MQRPVKLYPSPMWPAVDDGLKLSTLIAGLQRIDNAAPRDPTSKQSTATVSGLAGLRIDAMEVLSPAQVIEMRYERALSELEALVSASAARPGQEARPIDVEALQGVLATLRGPAPPVGG